MTEGHSLLHSYSCILINCILTGIQITDGNYQWAKCLQTHTHTPNAPPHGHFAFNSKQLIEIEILKDLPVPMLIGHQVANWCTGQKYTNGSSLNVAASTICISARLTWISEHEHMHVIEIRAYTSCYMMGNWQGERLHFVSSAVGRVNSDFAFHLKCCCSQPTDIFNEKGRMGRFERIYSVFRSTCVVWNSSAKMRPLFFLQWLFWWISWDTFLRLFLKMKTTFSKKMFIFSQVKCAMPKSSIRDCRTDSKPILNAEAIDNKAFILLISCNQTTILIALNAHQIRLAAQLKHERAL